MWFIYRKYTSILHPYSRQVITCPSTKLDLASSPSMPLSDPSLIFYRPISSLESAQSIHTTHGLNNAIYCFLLSAPTQHLNHIFSTRPSRRPCGRCTCWAESRAGQREGGDRRSVPAVIWAVQVTLHGVGGQALIVLNEGGDGSRGMQRRPTCFKGHTKSSAPVATCIVKVHNRSLYSNHHKH